MVMSVEDRGAGFDHESNTPGFGLFSIRERLNHLGGALQIDSKPGEGTRITVITHMRTGGPETSAGSA